MAASSSSSAAPFLTYLTVFKSRLGAVNLVLGLTDFAYTPAITLRKRLTALLADRVPLSLGDPRNAPVFEYLLEKSLVGRKSPRTTGRYQDFSLINNDPWQAISKAGEHLAQVPVYRTDLWLADPRLASTVGVPTPDNAEEVIELCHQLGLLTRAKSTWTAAGQLAVGLRSKSGAALWDATNPMMLGLESAVLLRQLLRVDGLLLRHLVEYLSDVKSRAIRRDAIALELPRIAAKALEAARRLRRPPPEIAEGRRFVGLLEKTATQREQSSRAPGVLEHRTAPRLEWLTDMGALSKDDLPKNGYEYIITDDMQVLNAIIASRADTADTTDNAEEIALSYWRTAACYRGQREVRPSLPATEAILEGYRVMQRSVGPAAIRDVCFAACLLSEDASVSHNDMTRMLLDWAASTSGVTVSGGRYSRGPELIHIAPKIFEQ